MTQRLKELEAAAKPHNHTTCNLTCLEPDLRLEGYKLCLEDVEPMLAAAQAYADKGSVWNLKALRDALAKFRGE